MNDRKKLGEILLDRELISREDLLRLLERQRETSAPLGEVALEMGIVTENQMLKVLSQHLGIDFLNIADNEAEVVDPALGDLLPHSLCRSLNVLPLFLYQEGGHRYLTLAMSDPLDRLALEEVARQAGANVNPILTTRASIDIGIEKLFSNFVPTRWERTDFGDSGIDDPVVFLNQLLARAVHLLASDIHIEPLDGDVRIRFRVDGVLRLMETLPKSALAVLVHRMKVMASQNNALMRTDNRRLPQDGSFARVVGGRAVDFRVSTFPTLHGEKVVVRILDRDAVKSINSICDIGMPPAIERQFRRSILRSGGIIIATGPTGSGKTTTLYAAINDIQDVGKNIVTVEDPVEYQAAGFVCQSSIKREAGFTYPVAIRAVLRQDPDIVLIGEIRDLESASMAVEAALTGHMILTTLHTEDAAGAIVRLLDIGIEQFMISSTVVSAINQRLLRRVCAHCSARAEPPTAEDLTDLGIDAPKAAGVKAGDHEVGVSVGAGGATRYHTGYSGRVGAFEMLTVTPLIKRLILERKTSDVIAEQARQAAPVNMIFEDALRLVLKGTTTWEELRRVHRGDYALKDIDTIFADAWDTTRPG